MKLKHFLLPVVNIVFVIFSNFYVIFNTPLVYSGGCSKKEYEAVKINYLEIDF